MNLVRLFFDLFRSGSSAHGYYEIMNQALKRISGEYTMLHYPLYGKDNDTFFESQANLTDYCLQKLGNVENFKMVEIGCGNGVQAKYILEKYNPKCITGIDLNRQNIKIANQEKKRRSIKQAFFLVDDAQKMKKIEDNSFDVAITIESASHYPDKASYLRELFRILKPGGRFLIADMIRKKKEKSIFLKKWRNKMDINHWHLDSYLRGFKNASLTLSQREDITPRVIRGFLRSKNWFRERKRIGFFSDLLFVLFYRINIFLYIYYLKRTRSYYVFSGYKPMW
jgi:ubiquinone/menaquinone biosynthesis C-methylase UbiE